MQRGRAGGLNLFLIGMLVGLNGCGGGSGGGGGGAAVGISLTPPNPTVALGATQAFTATVTDASNTSVSWAVQEGAAGGTITTAGVYTAPNTAGTYHVVAVSNQDPSKIATATITVPVQVSLHPPTATLTLQQSRQFAANVLGTPNTAVTWSLQEGAAGGVISTGGLYTAPNSPGTFHVVAHSQADPTQGATATITVLAGSASGVIQ